MMYKAEDAVCSEIRTTGASVQSTTGRRGVRTNGSDAGYTMFRGSVKSIGYPLHSPVSPSLPLPCVTVCHHISAGLYVKKPLGFKRFFVPRLFPCPFPPNSLFSISSLPLNAMQYGLRKTSSDKNANRPLSRLWRRIRVGEVRLHSFLISAADGSEWSTLRPSSNSRYSLNGRLRGFHDRTGRYG